MGPWSWDQRRSPAARNLATVVAQEPRLAAHIETMGANIAADLGVDRSRVNVKATTTEKMGFVGRAEGIAAHAVVLLEE